MTDCTCRSFPDRMCGCHLPFTPHADCPCDCPPGWPTRPQAPSRSVWRRLKAREDA